MIGIGIPTLISDMFNITKMLFIILSKSITERFSGSGIQRETNISLFLPLCTSISQMSNNSHCEFLTNRISIRNSLHSNASLIETNITKRNGTITTIQKRFNTSTLRQSCDCTILPMDRTIIRNNILKLLMSKHQSFKANFKSFIKQFPEFFFIAISNNTNLRKINRNDSLINGTSIISYNTLSLRLSLIVIHS